MTDTGSGEATSKYAWLQIEETPYWSLGLHEDQAYIGRAVAWLKRPGTMQRLSDLTLGEWADLSVLMKRYEHAMEIRFQPDHWNYAWLGNFFSEHGGHGHMHLISRYKMERTIQYDGHTFTDTRWGQNYTPHVHRMMPRSFMERLVGDLRELVARYRI